MADLAPELGQLFVGRRATVEVLGGGYKRFVHPAAPDDAIPWIDLPPDEPGSVEVKSRLLRLGISRERWDQAAPSVREAVRASVEALGAIETAAQAALPATPGAPESEPLAAKAVSEMLVPVQDFMKREETRRQGFLKANHRAFMHRLGRFALPPIVNLLREVKQEGTAEPHPPFNDPAWVAAASERINERLAGFTLSRACQPAALNRLRNEEPGKFARELVAEAAGLGDPSVLDRRILPLRTAPNTAG